MYNDLQFPKFIFFNSEIKEKRKSLTEVKQRFFLFSIHQRVMGSYFQAQFNWAFELWVSFTPSQTKPLGQKKKEWIFNQKPEH